MDQQASRHTPIARPRHDGWTQDKQVTFIIALRRTHNVSRAAAAAGMSRESAYRLRTRPTAVEFAAAWDRALSCAPAKAGAQTAAEGQRLQRWAGPLPSQGNCAFPIPLDHNQGHESHSPASRRIGLPARERHESHSSRQTAPHRQYDQLSAQERAGHVPSTEGRISTARRADLLARIEQASRG